MHAFYGLSSRLNVTSHVRVQERLDKKEMFLSLDKKATKKYLRDSANIQLEGISICRRGLCKIVPGGFLRKTFLKNYNSTCRLPWRYDSPTSSHHHNRSEKFMAIANSLLVLISCYESMIRELFFSRTPPTPGSFVELYSKFVALFKQAFSNFFPRKTEG